MCLEGSATASYKASVAATCEMTVSGIVDNLAATAGEPVKVARGQHQEA